MEAIVVADSPDKVAELLLRYGYRFIRFVPEDRPFTAPVVRSFLCEVEHLQ